MKKSNKRLLLWVTVAVCLLLGGVAVFRYFDLYGCHLPVVVIEPKLVPSGNNANSFVGHVFAHDKEDGKPSAGKDSIGMRITYMNVGSKSAYDVKRSVITILQKDNKLTVFSIDTSSFNTRRSAHRNETLVDEFYLPNFITADTQFLYVKFDYHSKTRVLMDPLREMFTYNHSLLDQHLPTTDTSTYASIKDLLLSRHLW